MPTAAQSEVSSHILNTLPMCAPRQVSDDCVRVVVNLEPVGATQIDYEEGAARDVFLQYVAGSPPSSPVIPAPPTGETTCRMPTSILAPKTPAACLVTSSCACISLWRRTPHHRGPCDDGFLALVKALGWVEDLLPVREHMAESSQKLLDQAIKGGSQ